MWTLSEMKKIFLVLLIISVCSIVINGTPITTTPAERRDSDGFNGTCKDSCVMMDFYPIRKRLLGHFTTFNNSDLLSARATCKSLHKLASGVLNRRIKPLIIVNGTVVSTIDQQIISTSKEHMRPIDWRSYHMDDFLTLQERQSCTALIFDDCNNPTSRQLIPTSACCLQVVPHDDHFGVDCFILNNRQLGNNHPRSALIFPKMYQANVYVRSYVYG
ncbi:hypothetical protein X798_00569 [Onchocerca flexuosa]|uniref:Uncharacterized protein n=1 Tax=Onchocerca flexuosa TaxID=387005 RepID=A0A238C6G0_9BILA|nr:hypothetical protein X798_00569 [Onchocerca flexuosa]